MAGPRDKATDEELEASNCGLLKSDDVRTGYIFGNSFEAKPVQYAVVDGLAVFEGCIVLGTVDEVERRSTMVAEVGSAMASETAASDVQHGVAITGAQYRWPGALMPYEIDPSLSNRQRVADAIAHWEKNTNVRFVLRTSANASSHPDYVRFIPSDGCWSYVGRRGGRQDIGLAGGCGVGATIHEIGHAFGLWHEQSREDRDSSVTIHWENIESGREHNFNQHIADGDDIGAYDFESIMHYGRYAFSKNGLPTITPKQSGVTIGQRNELSRGDIAAIHAIYRTWHNNLAVNQTYVTHHTQNAWLHLEGLGWRKIETGSADGVTNMLHSGVWARVKGKRVTALCDGSKVYSLYVL
jgi:hypothetical protein